MAESGPGKSMVFDDFKTGARHLAASTTVPPFVVGNASFILVGQGIADTDSSALPGVNGILLTATNELEHAIGLTTYVTYDVALHGTIVAEARVRFPDDLVTRECFFGFSDVQTDLAILEGAIVHGVTTTLTLSASDLCGFHFSSELTDGADWHGVFNGGTTTGVTDSEAVDLDAAAVADEFQILRVEMDNNGTARWFVDGKLRQTQVGAVSTTTNLCCSLIVEEKVTGNAQLLVDYLMIKAARDFNV